MNLWASLRPLAISSLQKRNKMMGFIKVCHDCPLKYTQIDGVFCANCPLADKYYPEGTGGEYSRQ